MKKRILSLLLAILMVVSILPAPTNAVDVETTADSGSVLHKLVKVNSDFNGTAYTTPGVHGGIFCGASYFPELLEITDVVTVSGTTYYQLSAADGYTWPELANNVGLTDDYWLKSENVEFVETEEPCGICGKPGCTAIHFYCDRCLKYDCGKDHLHCPACGEVDCTKTHTWCGLCGDYDCSIEHEDIAPNTVPIIPDNPTMTDGAEVSIVDEYGDPVTEEGFFLFEGTKSSLSAWSSVENASYQWQIRYDSGNDLWADIQGQRGKGILISPAMVLRIIEDQGSAAVRCTVTADGETLTSVAIPVEVLTPGTMAAFSLASSSEGDISEAAEDNENKVNLIINYVFADGKIAANPWAASLPAGVAYSTTTPITVPAIAGYAPVVDESGNYQNATLDGYQLSLSFSADDLKNDCTVNIVYQPAPVKVVVEHYQQNVDNDNYTLYDTEELSLVTGTTVEDVHKDYDGFYSLLYEHPTVAADGSTIIQVYYDRYYYLMKFELDGGYGVDPIYARYGAPIEIGAPTRPGYSFAGWSVNGQTAIDLPSTVPPENKTYYALWTPGDPVNYTVVYWKENADNTNYSYWTQVTRQATPGTVISGSNSVASYVTDEQYFTYNDHLTDKNVVIEGDGSTIINVYYNRNYYTLIFYYDGDCNIEEHTHDANCDRGLICGTDGHTHDATCERTQICDIPVHDHTAECLTCTKPIHPEHTLADCYELDCNKTSHNHIADGCTLACSHTHTLNCYTSRNGLERRNGKPNNLQGNSSADGIYTYTSYGSTRYVLKIGNSWYEDTYNTEREITLDCVHVHDDTCYTCGESQGVHTHSVAAGCYDLICDLAIHAAHTDAAGCYKDIAHSHTESCYTYQCGLEPHEHDETCYRACTEFAHTHGNSCEYGSGLNSDYEIYRVITAKYEADISDQWPTADDIEGFAYWTGTGVSSGGQSSKIHNMVANICIAGGNKFLAHYASTKYTLNYWFEHFDQTVTPDGTTYVEHDDVIYKLSEKYSQTAYYGSLTGWGYKDITGMIATAENAERDGNTFNLYYNRNRWDLKFHNVNKVIKTEENIMFEQPLANFKDGDGSLLSSFVPPYPSDSYEADTMEFEGWYTTPECFEGTKVNFNTLTMPNNDLTLYANWVPVSRTVRFFLDQADMRAGVTIPDKMDALWKETHSNISNPDSPYTKFTTRTNVPNKSYIADVTTPGVSTGYENHPYSGYTFVGWFYLDDGIEKAFDPANMPVTQNLDLYGKWSSNVLCPYEIYFALDENGDGVADTDSNGSIIYVADPITGSTLAGNSRTFDAKGDTALYADYQTGYYPNVASHTIDLKARDDNNDGQQDTTTFTFLYTPSDPVPYTVEYRDKATGERIVVDGMTVADKLVNDNAKAVVTENFKPISGYMPDAYQKTLVVVPGRDNVITFWYTKDDAHALYQVNHYVENLEGGWTEYRSATFTGEIGKDYLASAETITGFTFSDVLTNQYNTADKINAYTNTSLPGDVNFAAATDTVSGTLSANGMQLNLYYTRNVHTYKVQYLEFGTEKVLHPEKTAQAKYNQFISENAVRIEIDLDGDGKNEDFQLYEATKDPQTATIKDDSTILKFYYVRCTQDLTVTKKVIDEKTNDGDMPAPELSFAFLLTLHANDFHQDSYRYEIRKGDTVVSSGYKTVNDDGANRPTLSFSLMDGEKITFFGLPTAEYTVSEQNVPLGYYDTYGPARSVKLTVDHQVDVTVTNTYAPAVLEISKTVAVEEENTNTPEKESFEFTIQVPTGVSGSFRYTVEGVENTATVTDSKMAISLKDGQKAVFPNLPVGKYTVTETDFRPFGYNSYVSVNGGTEVESLTAAVELTRGTTNTVAYQNKFPVGDLKIQKTVSKEFYGIPWDGDSFTFTVKRTDKDRPLIQGNQYYLEIDSVRLDIPAVVDSNGNLKVTITFDQEDADSLKQTTDHILRTLVIKDLPTGTYSVTEGEYPLYKQSSRTVSNLAIPADETPKAIFSNALIRPTGSLYLEKELVPAEGYNPSELPKGTEFTFTIELTQEPPEAAAIQVTKSDGSATSAVTMTNGKFEVKLQADQSVVITGLPIGSYRITEATIPSYANSFAHRINGNWIEQSVTSTPDGRMYTDILVSEDTRADVLCTNTYPVNRAGLIIQKLVTKAYDRDILPGGSFTFNVTLAEEDFSSYDYKVYSQSGTEIRSETVTVTDKQFSISLEAGQYAVFDHMPVCGYTVEETANGDYQTNYQVYQHETSGDASQTEQLIATGDGTTVTRTFVAGKTDKVVFTNEYKKHLGELTVTKTVEGNPPTADTFVFHIYSGAGENKQKLMDVTIQGEGSITIYDLPLGTYTVTEDTSWNWRYTTEDASKTAVLTVDSLDAQVGFMNTYHKSKWINFFWNRLNEFVAVQRGDGE